MAHQFDDLDLTLKEDKLESTAMMEGLHNKLEVILNKIQTFSADANKLIKELTSTKIWPNTSTGEQLVSQAASATKVLQEMKERDLKKNNVVLVNLPECNSGSPIEEELQTNLPTTRCAII